MLMIVMKAFISSTYRDLTDYRKKTAEAVERLGQQGIRMEVFGARPEGATEVCRNEIDESDIFVGIYAHRYGFIPPGCDLSITEMEYHYAIERKKPAFCFVIDEDYPWRPSFIDGEPAQSKLKAFKGKINASLVRDTFTTPEELAFKVATSIGRYLFTKAIKENLDRVAEKLPVAVGSEQSRSQVARRAERLSPVITGSNVLLVNDIPLEMQYVIRMLESLNISVTIATDTSQALSLLSAQSFDLVISDMRRGTVPDEGLRLLQTMRENGLYRPVIFTVGQFEPERGTPPYAFGITNRIDEMLNLTFDVLERIRG
jgi:CheY-like chemotaxis protein